MDSKISTRFEWVNIPAGYTYIEDASERPVPGTPGGSIYVDQFRVMKYPITNEQYEEFLQHVDGYRQTAWWDYSTQAIEWRLRNAIAKGTAFSGDGYPRTNVCWFDAMAYCKWLSHILYEKITLPNERQWQRSAQADSNPIFPWGDNFSPYKCNFNSKGVTPVVKYPMGASAYGVMDLSGNVWEWCSSKWLTGSDDLDGDDIRVIRGGAWCFTAPGFFRAAYREYSYPTIAIDTIGFRCVISFEE